MESNCTTCKHAVFDEMWGEYKCKERHIRVYDILNDCKDYKPVKPIKTNEGEI